MSVTIYSAVTFSVGALVVSAEKPSECVAFEDLYSDGTHMCEVLFEDSFEVVEDESKGYDMYFFRNGNPNDDVSQSKGLAGARETCFLGDYNHKDKPTAEPLWGECGAYRDGACCKAEVVPNTNALKTLYPPEYHWDRCGPLSRQCEAFFAQEACFYECDTNIGYWRKYYDLDLGMPDNLDNDTNRIKYFAKCNEDDEVWNGDKEAAKEYIKSNKASCGEDGHNRWQVYKAPIKKSYCDSWYAACRKDLFCGNGTYFECPREYVDEDKDEETIVQEISTGAIAGIVIGALVIVIVLIVLALMILRERMGKPVFRPLPAEAEEPRALEVQKANE